MKYNKTIACNCALSPMLKRKKWVIVDLQPLLPGGNCRIHQMLLQVVYHLGSPLCLCLWKKTRPLSDIPWAVISKWDTLRCPHAHVLINTVMYARVLAKAHNHICAV